MSDAAFREALDARFWSKVYFDTTEQGCWLWTARPVNHQGYGGFYVDRTRRSVKAHRFSWELHYGPIPAGLFVCHRCDNTACVRPDHLFLGDQAANMADCTRKGRGKYFPGATNGRAKLTESDVLAIREACSTGSASKRATAKRYGIGRSTVCDIVNGRRWRHLEQEAQ